MVIVLLRDTPSLLPEEQNSVGITSFEVNILCSYACPLLNHSSTAMAEVGHSLFFQVDLTKWS